MTDISPTEIDTLIMDQLLAIPSLNPYVNNMPESLRKWIRDGVKYAFKEYLQKKKDQIEFNTWPYLYPSEVFEKLIKELSL